MNRTDAAVDIQDNPVMQEWNINLYPLVFVVLHVGCDIDAWHLINNYCVLTDYFLISHL